MKPYFKTLSLLPLAVCLVSCRPDRSSVPEMPVHVERHLATIGCLFPGNYWTLTRAELATDRIGYAGLILVMGFDNNYYAFDLCCPVEASASVRVGNPDEMLRVTCPNCGETYDLSWGMGTPMNGIADETLCRYRATTTPEGDIVITR